MKQPLPRDPSGARLAQLFSYRWSWIESPTDQRTPETEWKTNTKYPIKPRVLWTRWQDANTLIGVRFGNSTKYAMLDIDAGSPYIDLLPTIKGALETVGIVRTITLRSSWSGGLHLYIPLPQAYPTFAVACLLNQCLEAQGLHIAPGQLEIFPNLKPFGKSWIGEFTEYNAHRLPLQPASGSCVLDDDLNPIPQGDHLNRFFALWDNAVVLNDHETIAEALSIAKSNRRRRGRKAVGPAAEWRADLEHVISEGWTGRGQTNQLLKEIATYGRVFERITSHQELVDYIVKTATSRPGYEQWCNHQHEIDRRASQWSHAVRGFYWPLGDEPIRDRTKPSTNKIRADEARDRIAYAVRDLRWILTGQSVGEMVKVICDTARCSAQTLYKHLDLWHPERCVTAPLPGDSAEVERLRAVVRQSLGTNENTSFTPDQGGNEVCIVKTPPSKKFTSGGEERGCGGEKGLSTGSTGWLPPLDWQEGAVGDFG